MVAPSIPDSNLLLLGPSCDGEYEGLAVLVIATMAQGRPGGCTAARQVSAFKPMPEALLHEYTA